MGDFFYCEVYNLFDSSFFLFTLQLMVYGVSGVLGLHAVFPVMVVPERGSDSVILRPHNMADCSVWAQIHRWIIVTMSHVQVKFCNINFSEIQAYL